MAERLERYAWAVTFVVLVALAVPWFLWRVDTVVAGLPVWVWWHVGWLVLTTACFHLFTRRAWGLWVVDGGERA
jgi:hypothetical protein